MAARASEHAAASGASAPAMLSAPLRTLLLITAAIFAAFGAVLFVAPTWAAPRFPFEASPFAVMTAGSWFLGGAFLAWRSVRDARWPVVYPGIIYVAALPILETSVLIAHLDEVESSVVTWAYLVVLVVASVVLTVNRGNGTSESSRLHETV
jgi:peptidoglycan/LPS O-acetylase OafA/YrhL